MADEAPAVPEEDEVARNRAIAKRLLGLGARAAGAGVKFIAEGMQEAADDLKRGKPKAAEKKLNAVSTEARQLANSSTPQVSITLNNIAREADRQVEVIREERGRKGAIDAEYRVL